MSNKIFYLEIVMSMSHTDKNSNKLLPRIYFSPFFTSLWPFVYTLPVKLQPTKMAGNDRNGQNGLLGHFA